MTEVETKLPDASQIMLPGFVKHFGSMRAVIERAEILAAELLAMDETEAGETSWGEWVSNYIRSVANEIHKGDCGKARTWMIAPVTCCACVYDEYMVRALEKMRAEVPL